LKGLRWAERVAGREYSFRILMGKFLGRLPLRKLDEDVEV
jgi:hypothetical protein